MDVLDVKNDVIKEEIVVGVDLRNLQDDLNVLSPLDEAPNDVNGEDNVNIIPV